MLLLLLRDLYDNVVTAGIDINFTKVDTQAPTISSFSSNISTLTWYSSGSSSNKTAPLQQI